MGKSRGNPQIIAQQCSVFGLAALKKKTISFRIKICFDEENNLDEYASSSYVGDILDDGVSPPIAQIADAENCHLVKIYIKSIT